MVSAPFSGDDAGEGNRDGDHDDPAGLPLRHVDRRDAPGRGGGIVILDDPIKPIDAESEVARSKNNEWFDGTLFARIDNKERDSIILVMQRLHQNDLSGHLLEKGGFDLVALPAIAMEDEKWRLPGGRIARRKVGETPVPPGRQSLPARLDPPL
jgi:hypothetical protein